MIGYSIFWRGRGFGEPLVISLLANILTDNGIPTFYDQHRHTRGLVDCPLVDRSENSPHAGNLRKITPKYVLSEEPIMLQYLKQFERLTGRKDLKITRDHIPVLYHDIPKIPAVDVAINTWTGNLSIYRIWPYFKELQKLFDKNGISYIDLDKKKIFSIDCLNYVKKAKMYLGLESGRSHYVSQFANGKALILQSGFATFDYWAYVYNYDHLEIDVPCRPCWIDRLLISQGNFCPHDHKCMKEITVDMVFEEVREKIK